MSTQEAVFEDTMRQDEHSSDRATAVDDSDDYLPREYFDEDLMVVDTRRRTRNVLLGAGAGLLVVIALAAFFMRGDKQPTEAAIAANSAPAAAPVTISTATATVREIPLFIQATGSLIPFESTDVAPEVPGQVISTPVDVGDFVRKGQLLAQLDDREARLKVSQAEAALAQARAAQRQAREKLGSNDPRQVAEVESAKVQWDLAETNERRYRSLAESGTISRAQYDEFRVKAEMAKKQYEAALAAAKSGGAGVDMASSSVTAAEAQLGLAKKAVADSAIVAPFDGHVTERPTAAGEWVTTSSKIATVVQTRALKLVLTVSEADAGRIRLGMPVSLHVDAFPDREFTGQVGAINPSLDSSSRSLMVIVGVLNPDNILRPGMFASSRITEPSAGRLGVVVPEAAISKTSSGSSRVFVIRENRAEARVVQVGQTDGGMVHIVNGLAEGDVVATAGVDRLSDGAEVIR